MKGNQEGFQFASQKRPLFRGTCMCSYAHAQEASFPFSGVSLKFADISGYLRPNTLIMYLSFH